MLITSPSSPFTVHLFLIIKKIILNIKIALFNEAYLNGEVRRYWENDLRNGKPSMQCVEHSPAHFLGLNFKFSFFSFPFYFDNNSGKIYFPAISD